MFSLRAFFSPAPSSEPLSSGPETLRSARFEAAHSLPSEPPPSSEGYMPVLERSEVMPVARRLETLPEEVMEISDEDLELLFDEAVFLDDEEGPDTERMMHPDTEPPPITLRCPTG